MEGPGCHHPKTRPGRESHPSLGTSEGGQIPHPTPHTQFQDRTMVAAAWGLGSASSGREGRWVGGEVSPGGLLTASGLRGDDGVLWGWCCLDSTEQTWLSPSLAGTNSPTPKGSPPRGGSSSSSSRIRGAGDGAVMAGRTDGGTAGSSRVAVQPQPQRPARPHASSLRPGGFREPRPGGRGGRGGGGAAPSPASARALGTP